MKRKTLCSILILVLLVTLSLTSCNLIKSGTMKRIKGTYELTDYSLTYEADHVPEGSDALVNYKERDGIKMYLVIDGSGEGTVIYQSREVEAIRYKVSTTYTYDTDDTSKISYVNYKSGSAGDDKSIMHYEQLAVFATRTDVSLSYTLPNLRMIDWNLKKVSTDYIRFEKVSKKTDLSYVEDEFSGTLPREVDMTLQQFDGVLSGNSIINYVYYYIDFDYINKKADVYYAAAPEKAEGELIELTDIEDVVLRGVDILHIGGSVTGVGEIKIGDKNYTPSYRGSLSSPEDNMTLSNAGDIDIAERIETAKAFYITQVNGNSAE